jgi:hypothetical protein
MQRTIPAKHGRQRLVQGLGFTRKRDVMIPSHFLQYHDNNSSEKVLGLGSVSVESKTSRRGNNIHIFIVVPNQSWEKLLGTLRCELLLQADRDIFRLVPTHCFGIGNVESNP